MSAQVAQSVEQWTENPRVGGSIPSLGTMHIGMKYSKEVCRPLVVATLTLFNSQ